MGKQVTSTGYVPPIPVELLVIVPPIPVALLVTPEEADVVVEPLVEPLVDPFVDPLVAPVDDVVPLEEVPPVPAPPLPSKTVTSLVHARNVGAAMRVRPAARSSRPRNKESWAFFTAREEACSMPRFDWRKHWE